MSITVHIFFTLEKHSYKLATSSQKLDKPIHFQKSKNRVTRIILGTSIDAILDLKARRDPGAEVQRPWHFISIDPGYEFVAT